VPVAGQAVSALVELATCSDTAIAPVRTGSVIELRYAPENCPILPPVVTVTVPLGNLPAGSYDLRLLDVNDPSSPVLDDEAVFAVAQPPCGQGLCLLDGRFTVTAQWTIAGGATGMGQPVPLTDATGSFWFFGQDNYELMVKMLDACGTYQRFWFFAAGLTDVQVVLRVHDNLTGAEHTYTNPLGVTFETVADTQTFGCP
jgi:hypothetical protein